MSQGINEQKEEEERKVIKLRRTGVKDKDRWIDNNVGKSVP